MRLTQIRVDTSGESSANRVWYITQVLKVIYRLHKNPKIIFPLWHREYPPAHQYNHTQIAELGSAKIFSTRCLKDRKKKLRNNEKINAREIKNHRPYL